MVQVYIIGGDGTQKGAAAIYEVIYIYIYLLKIEDPTSSSSHFGKPRSVIYFLDKLA